jgi:hypothetical protein
MACFVRPDLEQLPSAGRQVPPKFSHDKREQLNEPTDTARTAGKGKLSNEKDEAPDRGR